MYSDAYLRVKELTTLEEETLARLDDQGNLRPREQSSNMSKHKRLMARVPVRKRDISLVRCKLNCSLATVRVV